MRRRLDFTEMTIMTTQDEKKIKRNNLFVAFILGAIALIGALVPLFYYSGLTVPQ